MLRNRMTLVLICLMAIQLVLLIALNFLARENSHLKAAIENMASVHTLKTSSIVTGGTTKTYSKRLLTNKNPRQFSPSEITILLLKRSDATFEAKLEKVKRLYPKTPVKVSNAGESVAKSLNHMLSKVQTDYFLVLEAEVSFSDKSNERIASLWDTLEQYPDIDFIGGSYLSGDKLYVSCLRFRLCKWVYTESYEYERSLDNIMICQGTSASFMGRKKSMHKIEGGFDEKISDLFVFKDFFIRAKSANAVVATQPSFILLVDEYKSFYDMWQSRDISRDFISFAVKHKVYIFKDEEENSIELCSSTSPLRGKELCIESNAHQLMLNGKHWAYNGLHTYPFLLGYLKTTLREVTSFFEENNVNYVVGGGVLLGAVKLHSILPWEAGDIDFFVYGMSLQQLLNLLEPWGVKMGYIVREHPESKAVHVFCTPKEIGDVSGGLATVFASVGTAPKFIRIKTNGIWVRYSRDLFEYITKLYGQSYLEHKLYRSKDAIECKVKGHNACLNFKSIFDGKGGTYREYFCES